MNMRIPSSDPSPGQRSAEPAARTEPAAATKSSAERRLEEAAAQAEDTFTKALFELFQHRISQGRTEEAIQAAARLVDGPPDPAERAGWYLSLGWAAEDAGRLDLAARLFQRGVELEPTSWFNWYWLTESLGRTLNALGRFAEAEPWCRAAIRKESRILEAHEDLGVSLEGQCRFAEAAAAFLSAINREFCSREAFGRLEALVASHRNAVAAKLPDIDVWIVDIRQHLEAREAASRNEEEEKLARIRARAKARAEKRRAKDQGGPR